MAETKKIVLEGPVKLAFFSGERDSKRIILINKETATAAASPCVESTDERRLESYICDQLQFPTDTEFDEMFKRLNTMRKKGLRPAEGVPDHEREGTKLRITVEIL